MTKPKSGLTKDHVIFDPNASELRIGEETREHLKSLRIRDIVSLIADVVDIPAPENGGQYVIRLRLDSVVIKQPYFAVGDRVRWHENGKWTAGEILALDPTDGTDTYAWVKEDGKWSRRTLSVRDLKR